MADVSMADSNLGFLNKGLSSCSELLLHNTYLDTTPWDLEGKAKPVTVRLGICLLASKILNEPAFSWTKIHL